jgi:hypothetical protein
MARKKKIEAPEPEELETELDSIEEDEPDDEPIVTERVNVHRTYQRRVPLGEIDEATEEIIEETPAIVAPRDPIAAAVDEMSGGSSDWEILVYALPNYHIDKKADFQSREYVTKFVVPDASYLLDGTYLEDIQIGCADPGSSNWFAIAIRKDRKVFRWINGIKVRPLSPQQIAEKVKDGPAPMPGMFPSIASWNQRSDGDFDKFFKMLKQMQSVGLMPALQAGQAAPPIDPEVAALQLIVKNPDVMETITGGLLRRFGGSGDGDVTMLSIVRDGLMQPEISKGAGQLLQGIASALMAWANQTNNPRPAQPPPVIDVEAEKKDETVH